MALAVFRNMIGTLIFFLATLSCSRANLDPAPELAALGYVSYTGVDYIPLDDMDPFVTDIDGVVAVSVADCATQCDATPGCNGASFYPDPDAFFGNPGMKNCWMKTFTDTCAPPATSVAEPLGALVMKPAPDCPPAEPFVPMVVGPTAAPEEVAIGAPVVVTPILAPLPAPIAPVPAVAAPLPGLIEEPAGPPLPLSEAETLPAEGPAPLLETSEPTAIGASPDTLNTTTTAGTETSSKEKKSNGGLIGAIVGGSLGLILLVVVVVFCVYRCYSTSEGAIAERAHPSQHQRVDTLSRT